MDTGIAIERGRDVLPQAQEPSLGPSGPRGRKDLRGYVRSLGYK